MTKEQLLNITLKQLKESLKTSPECFLLEDPELKLPTGTNSGFGNSSSNILGPTILWRFRVELGGKLIPDPNNATRSIIVTYTPALKQLSCHIYFREVNNINSAIMADAQATVQYEVPFFNESYRRFMSLRKKLIQRSRDKENSEFLKKLNNIFPTTGDDGLLK